MRLFLVACVLLSTVYVSPGANVLPFFFWCRPSRRAALFRRRRGGQRTKISPRQHENSTAIERQSVIPEVVPKVFHHLWICPISTCQSSPPCVQLTVVSLVTHCKLYTDSHRIYNNLWCLLRSKYDSNNNISYSESGRVL